jgi:hypothetical protein
MYKHALFIFFISITVCKAQNNAPAKIHTSEVGKAWANTSVNVTIFRRNSLVSWRDMQYTAFYDQEKYVVLAKRKLGTDKWETRRTSYKGNANDAHNVICIMTDGDGYLHMSWDHHNNPLNYCRSTAPGSLELTNKMTMTEKEERRVTYPEFYKMPNGNLLFFYRSGESGKGNLVINRYDVRAKKWEQLHSNLIDGEGQRSAYWQAFVDARGIVHLSWVWRETADVASNHDMCYAQSKDGGVTWQKTNGEKYQLPVTKATAEYACLIPQKSELINQTSMFADAAGHPYIATYWREAGATVPQYHIVYNNGKEWKTANLGFRQTGFSLSGTGTKRIPVSRPQVVAWQSGKTLSAAMLFRDEERGSKVSVAISNDIAANKWTITDLTTTSVGSWEPSYDTELWKAKRLLHVFVQKAEQVDGEGKADMPAEMVSVVEWRAY